MMGKRHGDPKFGAVAIENSANSKIGGKSGSNIHTTYSTLSTCPDTCPLKPSNGRIRGCYADSGKTGIYRRFLEAQVDRDLTADQIAINEAKAISQLPNSGLLRIHTFGDFASRFAARVITRAAGAWSRRNKQHEQARKRGYALAWTYTHNREVDVSDIDPDVSVLASVNSLSDAKAALDRGLAPTIVVRDFPAGKKSFLAGGITWIPCPEQTQGTPCADCRLCMQSARLARQNRGIAFKLHGPTRMANSQALIQLDEIS